MYVVHGYVDGVSYTATVGAASPGPDTGIMTGTPSVMALLAAHRGTQVSGHHTSGSVPLDLDDEASIMHALLQLTQVTGIEGDAPQLYEPDEAGAIY
jgi:hypothetical protein